MLIATAWSGCRALEALRSPVPPPITIQLPARAAEKGDPAAVPPASGGRLAYLGGDGNVYVTSADRATTIALTDDATAAPEGGGLSYHRLSWSPDGRLAFAAVTRAGDAARSQLYVAESLAGPVQVVGQSDEHFVIYIYWSPQPCPGRPGCRRLAYLIEEEDGIGLRLVEMEAGRIENWRAGAGWPFYFSWAPDGRSMVWHTGGARRQDEAARLVLYDVERDQVELLPQTPGLFLAPAWSPQGDRWLGVAAAEDLDQLQSFNGQEPVTLTSAPNGEMVFAWSPAGDQVAYAIRKYTTDPFYGPIYIFDLATGRSRRLTDVGLRILGFFWAPDGRRLGYITWLPLQNADWMQWRVYDLAEERDRGFKAFYPSAQMRFVISSFNQYAQSHRFWSPDGRYLVYADRNPNFVERVWLIDTLAEAGADPILIDTGSFGVWSWD